MPMTIGNHQTDDAYPPPYFGAPALQYQDHTVCTRFSRWYLSSGPACVGAIVSRMCRASLVLDNMFSCVLLDLIFTLMPRNDVVQMPMSWCRSDNTGNTRFRISHRLDLESLSARPSLRRHQAS